MSRSGVVGEILASNKQSRRPRNGQNYCGGRALRYRETSPQSSKNEGVGLTALDNALFQANADTNDAGLPLFSMFIAFALRSWLMWLSAGVAQ
jgi:hypothetical protein